LPEHRNYWLLKTEPDAFSYDTLVSRPDATEHWDGVRNYLARNRLREMKRGDVALIYHSRCTPPHVAGIAEVVREAYPDPSSWDPDSKYYDPKSRPEAPRWFMVDVKAVRKLEAPVSLQALKDNPRLADMAVTQRGQRVSVLPVTAGEFEEVLHMAAELASQGESR
jgi:predicted RNA-binding protein with PUA-like domain